MRLLLCLLIAFIPLLSWAQIVGNAAAGKQKSPPCAACHGADGNSTMPAWPKLAGQHAKYLQTQLQAFKQGKEGPRDQAVMFASVANLTEQDIADLAAYFASQSIKAGSTDEKYIALGQKLYRGGDMKRGIPACSACHDPQGSGNAQAGFPALSGQFAEYTMAQLRAYRSGQRRTDINEIMRDISAKLTDADIEAISHYVAGLH